MTIRLARLVKIPLGGHAARDWAVGGHVSAEHLAVCASFGCGGNRGGVVISYLVSDGNWKIPVMIGLFVGWLLNVPATC